MIRRRPIILAINAIAATGDAPLPRPTITDRDHNRRPMQTKAPRKKRGK